MLGLCAIIFAVLGNVKGCSPPEGGYVAPTAAQIVFYADYVALGRVTRIIKPDPVYRDNSVYGAELQLSCQYKGGNIPSTITVSGAGYIPGHCTTKDLHYNTEYILFLSKRDSGYFEQTSAAENTTELGKFLQVCSLMLNYPLGMNQDILKERCPAPKNSSDCQKYDQSAKTRVPTSPLPETIQHLENAHLPVQGATQKSLIRTTPASGTGAVSPHAYLLALIIMHQAFMLL